MTDPNSQFRWIDEDDGADSSPPQNCPFCGGELWPAEGHTPVRFYCANDDCRFCQSADVRRVYRALRAAQWSIDDAATACAEIPVDVDEGFSINSRERAEWLLKRLARANAEIAEIDAAAEREILAIRQRAEECKRHAVRTVEWLNLAYGAQFEEFVRRELEGRRERSLQFLYGRAGFRTTSGSIVIDDENAGIQWARENQRDELIKVTLRPAEVKRLLSDPELSEQIAQFAHVEGAGDRFYVDAILPTPTATEREAGRAELEMAG